MEYFIHRNGQQSGPYKREELQSLDLTQDTLVWYIGLNEWKPAGQCPDLAFLFAQPTPPPTPNSYQQSTSYGPQQPFGNPGNMPPARPSSYLAWSIIVTVLCCLPFGIVAIIKSASVNERYNIGDYVGAEKASKSARNWCIAAACTSVGLAILYVLFYVICFAATFSSFGY